MSDTDPGKTTEDDGAEGEPAQGDRRKVQKNEKLERRAFFVEGFRNLVKPLSSLVEERLDQLRESMERSRQAALGGAESTAAYRAIPGGPEMSRLLRPPGALEEELFLDRCASSGQCVSVCPVQAIRVLESDDDRASGTPYVDPQIQACVVCDDLACMQVCPSGALQNVPRHLIHMGVAEMRQDICLRTDGEDCQICVEKCPLGADAIEIAYQGAEVEVKSDGCIGCGVCEMYCPTEPRAIVVRQE